MLDDDSLRAEGEMAAVRTLRGLRVLDDIRDSEGWCFLQYAESSRLSWERSPFDDMFEMRPGKEYMVCVETLGSHGDPIFLYYLKLRDRH